MSPLRFVMRACRSRDGVTLMELLIVSMLTVFLLLVATMISVTQTNLAKKTQQTTLSQAPLAVRAIVQLVRRADRVVLYSTGDPAALGGQPSTGLAHMQVVLFQPLVSLPLCNCSQPVWPACCTQISGNWIWSEIAAISTSGGPTPDTVRIFDNTNGGDCSQVTTFTGLNVVTFEFRHDIAPPMGIDTNLMEIRVDTITETAMLGGQVPAPNATLTSAVWDTGYVLSPPGPPPALCPDTTAGGPVLTVPAP